METPHMRDHCRVDNVPGGVQQGNPGEGDLPALESCVSYGGSSGPVRDNGAEASKSC